MTKENKLTKFEADMDRLEKLGCCDTVANIRKFNDELAELVKTVERIEKQPIPRPLLIPLADGNNVHSMLRAIEKAECH